VWQGVEHVLSHIAEVAWFQRSQRGFQFYRASIIWERLVQVLDE
jgi:hypothetical protein